MLRELMRALRPRQWLKNVLVVGVPAAAGKLLEADVAAQTAAAFAAFCCASSAAYLLNDVGDRELDRNHPSKRHRPIAAGRVSVRLALAAAAALALAALGIALLATTELAGAVAGYLALTTAYSRGLKHVPVFDIATVSAGFFLRAVAGGLATGIAISQWFLIVAAGASFFVVAGKRYAELRSGNSSRRVLDAYSTDYLESIATLSATVTIVAYCLWAFEAGADLEAGWRGASAVPFVLAIMRYWLLIDHGHGEEPEELLLSDRVLLALGACWGALLGLGVAL